MTRRAASRPSGLSCGAGESAGAGLPGLMAASATRTREPNLQLDRRSHALLFGTEGATDPAVYGALVTGTSV